MSSEPQEQMNAAQQNRGEDDLLGVIADVEKQLESLKAHRAERDAFRQRLEDRERELSNRSRDLERTEEQIRERMAALKAEDERFAQRSREMEAAEAELGTRRAELESDFAALAEEQKRAAEGASREAAELKNLSMALEQREQRLSEHAANISKQREAFEAMSVELARRQEAAEAEAAELAKSREAATELERQVEQLGRRSSDLEAELERARSRAVEVEQKASELTHRVQEAQNKLEEQTRALNEQLRVAREEVRRAGEAQSSLMAELVQREKSVQEAKRESELLRAEAARRQASLTEAEARVADFKRQLIERDARVQELSSKLAAATTKFREVSQTLQEQAALAEQAQALQMELAERDRTIEELRTAKPGSNETAHKADLEALENQLQQMGAQLEEARRSNRELKAKASSKPGTSDDIPSDVGEAIITRWRRLRLMRSLLEEQGTKLQEASEAVRQRYAQAEQVLAQREQLSQARTAIAAAQGRIEKLQSRAAVGKAGMAMFYLVGTLAGLAGLSWAVSGEVTPARYAARAIINADTGGRQTSDDQFAEWLKYLEMELKDPRFHEVAAERMNRAGIVSLSSPGQISQRIEKDLIAESAVPGTFRFEYQGEGKAKTVRELDTLLTALVSQANATKERRADGLGVIIAEKPNAGAGPIDNTRVYYAGAIFGLGLVFCFGVGGYSYTRLAKSKTRIEDELNVDDILDNANWKQAEELMRKR